jgi:hypothetical protein
MKALKGKTASLATEKVRLWLAVTVRVETAITKDANRAAGAAKYPGK